MRPPGSPVQLERRRVAEVIQRSFWIHYHPNHIWRVLVGLGWSCQKPERRAQERDEEAIERWKKRRWPEHPDL